MQCSRCNATKETARIPSGWKRVGDEVLCESCKHKAFVLRAVTIPVASVDDWDEFRGELKSAWALTTNACNWMMTQLYVRDVRRNGEPKMPKMEKQYLYPEARARFPQLPSQSVAALEQAVTKKYRAKRYDVVWASAASLPTFRYPTPFPVPNQGWSAWSEDGRPHVSVKLDRRWTLRLRGGHEFRRQLASFAAIASGDAVRGQLDLYPKDSAIMCKMVAWLPRRVSAAGLSGALHVRTMPDSLLRALNAKDEKLWEYHGDHIRRWSAEHAAQLQRWADDSKFEQRPVPSFAARRTDAAVKYRDRMASAIKETAAQLVGYAERRKFAVLRYDDTDTSYVPKFQWFALRERIALLCDEAGIMFEHASGAVEPESADPLASGEAE